MKSSPSRHLSRGSDSNLSFRGKKWSKPNSQFPCLFRKDSSPQAHCAKLDAVPLTPRGSQIYTWSRHCWAWRGGGGGEDSPVIIALQAFSSNEIQEKEVWSVKTAWKSQRVHPGVERGFPGYSFSSYELTVEEGWEGSPGAMVLNH